MKDHEEYADLEHIWGVKSYDDLSGSECNLWTMNDIEVVFWKETGEYSVDIETIYAFESQEDAAKYLQRLLDAFTAWMQEKGYKTDAPPSLYGAFAARGSLHFKSIEDAYMDFKLRVKGFCAQVGEE